MNRFLISTLLGVILTFTILPVITFAQNNNSFVNSEIKIDGTDYIVTEKIDVRAAKSQNGALFFDKYQYIQVIRAKLKDIKDDVYIWRTSLGSYQWYQAPGQIAMVLSDPLKIIGTTTSNITVYRARFSNTDYDIVTVKENGIEDTSRFEGYKESKHGPLDNPASSGQQSNTTTSTPSPTPTSTSTQPSNSANFAKLPNPLGGAGVHTTGDAISKLTTIVMVIAVPFVTIMIMYAGFSYIAAYGNPEKIRSANKRALWTLVGTLLLFGAATIGNLIIKTVQKVTTDGIPASTSTTTNTTTNQPPVTTTPSPIPSPAPTGTSTTPTGTTGTTTANELLDLTFQFSNPPEYKNSSGISYVETKLNYLINTAPIPDDTITVKYYLGDTTNPNALIPNSTQTFTITNTTKSSFEILANLSVDDINASLTRQGKSLTDKHTLTITVEADTSDFKDTRSTQIDPTQYK